MVNKSKFLSFTLGNRLNVVRILKVTTSYEPIKDGSHRLARMLMTDLTHLDADIHHAGHSSGLVICGDIPKVDCLAIGELDIIATWALGLCLRAVDKGFQGWSVSC